MTSKVKIVPTIYKTFMWSVSLGVNSARMGRGNDGEFETQSEALADYNDYLNSLSY